MSQKIAEEENRPSIRWALGASALVALGTFTLFYLVWHQFIRPYYFPISDDLSLIVNSTSPFHPSWASWFLQGFKNYFDVYPDSFVPYTNFIRPVVNLTFFLDYVAFGSHWSMYLLTTYGFVSVISGLTSFIAYYVLKLDWRMTLLAAICAALAPSLATAAFFYPSDGFDLLAGALVLSGILALLSDALIPALVIFTIAVFTKETALFAPCVAAIIVFIRKGNKPATQRCFASASFLFPVIAWALLYWHDFFKSKIGIYIVRTPDATTGAHALFNRPKALLHWPIAAVDKIQYWRSPHMLLKIVFIVSLGFNVVAWLLLVWMMFRFGQIGEVTPRKIWLKVEESVRTSQISILAIFCVGSILMPLAFRLPNRFGGIFYPLFVLCLACAASRSKYVLVRSYSMLMIAAIGIVGGALIYADISYNQPTFRSDWAMSENYVGILSRNSSPRVFTFDDISGGFAATESVQRFSGSKAQLIRLDDLTWNFTCAGTVQDAIKRNSADQWILYSKVPRDCGEHDFNGLLLYDLSAPIIVFERKIAGERS